MAYASTKSKKKKIALNQVVQVGLFFLTVFIFVFLMVTRNTNLRLLPKASVSDVTLGFQTITSPDKIKVMVEAGNNSVGFARVKVLFDKTKVNLTAAPIIHPQFQTITTPESVAVANGAGSIELILGLSPTNKVPIPTGSITLAELPYTLITTSVPSANTLTYDTANIQIVDLAPKELTYTIEPYTFSQISTPNPTRTDTSPTQAVTCRKTGCNNEVCSDREVMTTCVARPQFACYTNARCERQTDNTCGWTMTAELQACLDEHQTTTTPTRPVATATPTISGLPYGPECPDGVNDRSASQFSVTTNTTRCTKTTLSSYYDHLYCNTGYVLTPMTANSTDQYSCIEDGVGPTPTPTSVIPNAPSWFFLLPSNLKGFLEQLYLTVFVFQRQTSLQNLLEGLVP